MFFAVLSLSLLTSSVVSVPLSYPSFENWALMHGRVYNSPTERDYRQSVYTSNLARVIRHNTHNHSYWLDVNKFADLSRKEFADKYISGGYNNNTGRKRNINWNLLTLSKSVLPTSVDWTTKGAVTPVKNQEQCGSCWAFSTTGSTEGAWFLKNGTLVSLSEQQLVDCSGKEGNQGCNGGLMDYGFQYIIDNKGITTEAAYPYTAQDGTCVKNGLPVAARLSSFKDVPTNSETALMTAVSLQPVSVAVEADQDVFQLYAGGVMTKPCGTNLDHGVLAVGYGTLGGEDFWLVKNSWGADWGVKGYIMLGRGTKFSAAGQCGIQMDPSYPVV
jgi:C1A family cysteine protease